MRTLGKKQATDEVLGLKLNKKDWKNTFKIKHIKNKRKIFS